MGFCETLSSTRSQNIGIRPLHVTFLSFADSVTRLLLDICDDSGYNTCVLIGVVLSMNELILTLFVMLLFLVGVTVKT